LVQALRNFQRLCGRTCVIHGRLKRGCCLGVAASRLELLAFGQESGPRNVRGRRSRRNQSAKNEDFQNKPHLTCTPPI
jgi:hypothetical protein